MCWNVEASIAMVGLGAVATGVTVARREPPAIWLTIGYFTVMEVLQLAGYAVLDQCGTTANQSVTVLSYLHIVFQPFLINAFAMELVPSRVKRSVRKWVFAGCAASAAVMLVQLVPWDAVGPCVPGQPLCGDPLCTRAGNWHIAWHIPYNGLLVPVEAALGTGFGFPTYILATMVLPLTYGAWRFVLVSVFAGPVLASMLTSDPNEMPAVWCLFSIFILLIALSSRVRQRVSTDKWWGRPVQT